MSERDRGVEGAAREQEATIEEAKVLKQLFIYIPNEYNEIAGVHFLDRDMNENRRTQCF